ncbi:NADH-quinone oxidoreductase subunit H [Zunongwangia sp. H14]|uniref:complex I subunit 1/NuoH family protein n=1 Tax=Zunongwangia sp. H14 TaxID=3240792 RepID=UPI003565AC1F
MMWILILVLFFFSIYAISVVEHWSVYRRWDFLHPFSAFAFSFTQEDIKPRMHDKTFLQTAPILFIVAAVLSVGVLPFAKDFILVRIGTAALFINAALAYIMVSMVLAGWAPNGLYSMIGGWRFLGQLIAYSMPIVMAITSTVMRAESMNMTEIVESQYDLWNIIYQPLGFILFYLASLALAFLPPFDIPNSTGELSGGIFSEYTGKRLLVFRIGRLILIFSLALATANLFLGGWYGPYLPGFVWIFLKTGAVAISYFFAGRLMPRLRHDHTLEWSWKYGTPLALTNILWVGILLLL